MDPKRPLLHRLVWSWFQELGREAKALPYSWGVNLDCVPAPRPRLGRGGRVYYAGQYPMFMKQFRQAVPTVKQAAGPVACWVEVVKQPFKTVSRQYPKGDVDNLAKGVMDAITKELAWADDEQAVLLVVYKRFAEKGEDTHIQTGVIELS